MTASLDADQSKICKAEHVDTWPRAECWRPKQKSLQFYYRIRSCFCPDTIEDSIDIADFHWYRCLMRSFQYLQNVLSLTHSQQTIPIKQSGIIVKTICIANSIPFNCQQSVLTTKRRKTCYQESSRTSMEWPGQNKLRHGKNRNHPMVRHWIPNTLFCCGWRSAGSIYNRLRVSDGVGNDQAAICNADSTQPNR